MSSAKCCPFRLGLNVLISWLYTHRRDLPWCCFTRLHLNWFAEGVCDAAGKIFAKSLGNISPRQVRLHRAERHVESSSLLDGNISARKALMTLKSGRRHDVKLYFAVVVTHTPWFKGNRIFWQCGKVVFRFNIISLILCVMSWDVSVWVGNILYNFVCAVCICSCLKSKMKSEVRKMLYMLCQNDWQAEIGLHTHDANE